MTSESLWNFYRDEINDSTNENNHANNYRIIIKKTTTSKSFDHKTELIGSTPDNNSRLNAEAVVLLKYLNNFWRSLDLPLIICEIELELTWSKYCVISEISRTPEVEGNNPADETLTNWSNISNNAKL